MIIALYKDLSSLPFGKNPKLADEIFEPWRHGRRKLETSIVRKSWVWPILMGLHAIKLPIMAHVSGFENPKNRRNIWGYPHIMLVQITTLPPRRNKGIPITVENGKAIVENLVDECQEMKEFVFSPGSTSCSAQWAKSKSWKEKFTRELKEAKEEAIKEADRASTRAAIFSKLIP